MVPLSSPLQAFSVPKSLFSSGYIGWVGGGGGHCSKQMSVLTTDFDLVGGLGKLELTIRVTREPVKS